MFKLLFVLTLCGFLGVGSAVAETTISDNILSSGKLAKVSTVKSRGGKWEATQIQVEIGLEALPSQGAASARSQRGFDGYQLVIDLSRVAQSVPLGCGTKLAVPWKMVRARFEKQSAPPEHWMPELLEADHKRYQTVAWKQGDCAVVATFEDPLYKSVGLPGRQPYQDYGLTPPRSQRDRFQVVQLSLEGAGNKGLYAFVVPFVEATWRQ